MHLGPRVMFGFHWPYFCDGVGDVVCVLVFVSFGHVWVPGAGTLLVQGCYYDCGNTTKARWYDRVYAIPYGSVCVGRFVES